MSWRDRATIAEQSTPADSAQGVVEPGNIDLTNRPRVKNPDGSISTVRSMGVNIDGKEVLLPTVSDDGRNLTKDEAIDQYKRTGKHLGVFSSPEASTAYAKQLHEDQAKTLSNGSWRDRAVPADPGSIRGRTGTEKAIDTAEEFAKNVGQNALDIINPVNIVKSLADTAKKGLYEIPKAAAESSVGLVKGTAKAITGGGLPSVNDVRNSPIIKKTEEMAGPIAKDPAGFAFKRPLDAATLLLTPILPFLGKGASAVAENAATVEAPAETAGLGRRIAAKTISTALGANEEAVLERMNNPSAVKTAFTHPELADQMVNSVKNLRDTVGELDTKAIETLRSSPFIEDGAIPKTQIADAIKASRRDLGGVFSKESQAAAGALKKVTDLYKKLRNTVSETQVKGLVQQLDSDINWGDPSASRTNEALVGVRTRLDGILKKQNPHYAEAMRPVAEGSRLMSEMQKKFGIERKTGEGFSVTDQTVNKIKSALKEDRLGTMNILNRFQKLTGEDFVSKIKNANVSAAFDGATTQGSRRAVIGGTLGGASGYALGAPPWVTSAIGTVAGAFADIYGRRVAGVLADALSEPQMRKYIPQLKKASLQGAKAVAVLHAKLIENDPEYTTTMASAIHGHLNANSPGAKR